MLKTNLTDRKLLALRPAKAGQRYQVMDALVPGFGVRVTDTGARTFILRIRYPGSSNPNRRALGEYPVLTLEEAREKARTWRTMVKRGVDPSIVEQEATAAATRQSRHAFEAVAEDWFIEKVRTERKGREVEREVRNEFISRWGKRAITDVTEADVLTVIKDKKRAAPSQARNLLGHAKRLFTWAIDQRCYGLTTSPCDHLKSTKVIGERATGKRVLSDAELFALWRASGRVPYPHGPVYRMLMLTALRLNEAADAARPEFDMRNRLWTIPESRMKGKGDKARSHAVPLTDEVLMLLESVPQFRGPYLFSTNFGQSPVWMSDKVKKRVDQRMLRTLRALARRRGEDPRATQLQRWTNHDIRRTVRSRLSGLKIAETVSEAVLAHVRPGIRGIYDQHDYADEKREALELWADRLRQLVAEYSGNVMRPQARG